MSRPQVGERYDDPDSAHLLEWTGDEWAPVCPADNIAMTARDGGWLCCSSCGTRAVDINRNT